MIKEICINLYSKWQPRWRTSEWRQKSLVEPYPVVIILSSRIIILCTKTRLRIVLHHLFYNIKNGEDWGWGHTTSSLHKNGKGFSCTLACTIRGLIAIIRSQNHYNKTWVQLTLLLLFGTQCPSNHIPVGDVWKFTE